MPIEEEILVLIYFFHFFRLNPIIQSELLTMFENTKIKNYRKFSLQFTGIGKYQYQKLKLDSCADQYEDQILQYGFQLNSSESVLQDGSFFIVFNSRKSQENYISNSEWLRKLKTQYPLITIEEKKIDEEVILQYCELRSIYPPSYKEIVWDQNQVNHLIYKSQTDTFFADFLNETLNRYPVECKHQKNRWISCNGHIANIYLLKRVSEHLNSFGQRVLYKLAINHIKQCSSIASKFENINILLNFIPKSDEPS